MGLGHPAKECLGRGNSTLWAGPRFDGIPGAIDRPVGIDPFTADLHISLIHMPRRSCGLHETVAAVLELRRIMVHPTHHPGVDHRQATLAIISTQFPQAKLATADTSARHDDLAIELPT